jgi:hypothetical protein
MLNSLVEFSRRIVSCDWGEVAMPKKAGVCPHRRDSATLPFTLKTKLASSIGMLALVLLIFPAQARAAGSAPDAKLSVFVDCHCSDPVGGDFCSALKDQVGDSVAYRLVDHADAYGIGVHLWCVDLFTGLLGVSGKLSGTMSAVSVTFTIYADGLPGEVYEDSSVFRVGKNATDEMSQRILSAVGQMATANKTVFEHIRTAPKPVATPTMHPVQ